MKAFLSGKGRRHGHGPQANLYWTLYGWTCGTGTGGGGCTRHRHRDYVLAQA